MKVLWIFAQNRRCGISIYSNDYIGELEKKCDVIVSDPFEWLCSPRHRKNISDTIDLVHIQYEASFFMNKRKDIYFKVLSGLKGKPLIVSLHEVHDQFPMVYPRDKIDGPGLIRAMKRVVYDCRHPLQTTFRKACRRNFGASLILVHHQYHKNILLRKGVKAELVEVIDHPVKRCSPDPQFRWAPGKTLILGSTGFVNPAFDYELLFSVLEKMDMEWKFFWIGGIRTGEQQEVFQNLAEMINSRGWGNRFIITGWVTDEKQSKLLNDIDIYFAFFKYRSSSGSLYRAIGALKPVIATEIELTKELGSGAEIMGDTGPVYTIQNSPEMMIQAVKRILSDHGFRSKLLLAAKNYSEKADISNMADRLLSVYRRFTG